MNRKYLLDVIIENNLVLKPHKINLITTPCGTGKTTYFFEYLCNIYNPKKILYLVDTTMLQQSMLNEYSDKIMYYDRLNIFRNKVSIMSYQKFGTIIIDNHDFINNYDLIVLDEGHNIIKYSNMGIDDIKRIADNSVSEVNINKASSYVHGCTYLKLHLTELVKEYKTVFLLLTATPSSIYNYLPFSNYLYDVLQGIELEGYTNKLTLEYKDNFRNAITLLKDNHKEGDKILIYSKRINTCKHIKEHMQELGYNVETLHSINNNSEAMTEQQLQLRDYIIKNNRYPDKLDALIINGAYETGWNLKDDRVQTVILNTSEIDTAIQVRGRCRHDINLLIQKTYNFNANNLFRVLEEYKNIKVFTKDEKQEILENLAMFNDKGKLIGWNVFKKLVNETEGYFIKEGNTKLNGKSKRYSIILEKED